jgi:hypothetical protein
MNSPADPDYAAIARSYGLTAATYSIDKAFEHLGVKDWLGWKLVRQGALRAIRLTGKKTVVPAVDIAKLLHQRQQQPPKSSQAMSSAGYSSPPISWPGSRMGSIFSALRTGAGARQDRDQQPRH